MKKSILFLVLFSFLFIGCKDSNSSEEGSTAENTVRKKKKTKTLGTSFGTVNTVSIIIEDDLWKSEIGETIREVLTRPVKGLPQDEPLFNLSRISPQAFTGFTRTSRIFIKVEPAEKPDILIVRDTFASPQTGIFIKGKHSKEIRELVENNAHEIIRTLKQTEIRANQQRIAKSLKDTKVLEDRFGMTMNFPSVYRYAKEEDDFVWIRKDIRHGSMEILVYQVPIALIDKDTNVVASIVKMRDSIGKRYIPGPDEGTYMRTEEAYMPYLFETQVDQKFTYLTKGTWEVEGAFMAGPFVNYAIKDEKNDRYLILEGFVFKPQAPTKRNNVFELEAIFKSAKILN